MVDGVSFQNPREYMVVEMNSEGGVRVHFKYQYSRLQFNTRYGDFADGNPHIINLELFARHGIVRLQVVFVQ